MNLFGYVRSEPHLEDEKPVRLREVSVVADDPAELRRIAQFFVEAAGIVESRKEQDPETYDGLSSDWHLHYEQWTDTWSEESGDLIVFRPRS
jgi:hypothetical protein